MGEIELKTPLDEREVSELRAGDVVKVTGEIVTARDKAYARALKILRSRKKLPLNLERAVVYHCGPLAEKNEKGWRIISAGPTTSARMDDMQVEFVRLTGVKALIGKGGVGEEVARELSRLGCVYLAFTGGAGVLAARAVKRVSKVFWLELGEPEAVWVLKVEKFGPLIVGVDALGGNLYRR